VAALVVGGALALLVAERDAPLGAEDDLLEGVVEVGGLDRLVAGLGGADLRNLVNEARPLRSTDL